jgi:serine/threonine-protein kinase HipA
MDEWQASLFFDPIASFGQYLRLGTSAGGAKPKALVGYDGCLKNFVLGGFHLPEGYRHGILKFSGFEENAAILYGEGGLVEYAYHLLALQAGISMAPSYLVEIAGLRHFLTERFDRVGNEKMHFQSLCGLCHFDLRARGRYDYADLAGVARRMGLGAETYLELFRRAVFNVVMRNQDDHTKNIGFLMDKLGNWSLAPAFDMTFSYNADGRWTRVHRLGVMGKFGDICRSDLMQLGRNFGMEKPELVINEVVEACSKWERVATELGISRQTKCNVGGQLRLWI